MKKKICKYLDGNEMGMAMLYGDYAEACCDRSIIIMPIEDFSKIDAEKYMQLRTELIEGINNGSRHECDGCAALCEKEETDIDTKQFSWMNIGNFTTCNLRCKYCYYNETELGAKLDNNKKYLLPILKKFHESNLLRDDICVGIAGGESTLFEDIPESLEYLQTNFKNPRFNLQSNSSITPRVRLIGETLKRFPMSWKNLYTSIDAGTRETYKKIRGKDLFYDVIDNLLYYVKNNVFTELQIKYILLDNQDKDMYNLSMQDIYGFCNILKQLVKNNRSKTTVIIDRDLNESLQPMNSEMLKAGGIIAYAAKELNISVVFSPSNFINEQDCNYMKHFAKTYCKAEKSKEEAFLHEIFINGIVKATKQNINTEKNKINIPLYKKAFSLEKTCKHLIIRILGFKISV